LRDLLLVIPCAYYAILEPLLFASISLKRILQVLFREDRKRMLGNCFSVLAYLIIHGFDLALHAYFMMLFPYNMFIFIFFLKKNLGEKMQGIFFFFSWHVKYCLYFCLISQFIVH
jgi:hypothetical protein